MAESLVLLQLLAGRDHATTDPIARQMANFSYVIGCRERRECLLIDPSWDPRGIAAVAAREGLRVVGVVATHGHPDHVGGEWMNLQIKGLRELQEKSPVPVHVHQDDLPLLTRFSGLDAGTIVSHSGGDTISVGNVTIDLIHSPGHTPGGICLHTQGNLLTGDVLFVGACGRVDLPGSNPRQMFASLQHLATLPAETVVWPGHDYGPAPRSTIGQELRSNPSMQGHSAEEWMRWMGHPGL
jgi:glyoxylase-like metal-dependent hydrolase (beta-lactamase superfamily II)